MKSRCVRPCAKREKETKQTGKRIDYGRFCWLETRPLHFSRTESGQLKVTLSARKDVPLNKTNMLGTIKCFRFDERPRKKQDFGVAERGARGTNKTSALPSMPPEEQTRLQRCRAWRPRNKQDFSVAEHGARGTNKTSALPTMPPEEQTRLRRCRPCRPRNKQDFGVADHAARGTNKTSALPSMARPPLMWKWRE